MAEKQMNLMKERSTNFTQEESNKLRTLLMEHPIITCKKTDHASTRQKDAAWQILTAKFNSDGTRYRTTKQLLQKFNNIKKNARKEMAAERNARRQTGGGPAPPGPSATTEWLNSITGEAISGLPAIYDSDVIDSPPWDLEARVLALLYQWHRDTAERGSRPTPRETEVKWAELRDEVLMVEWKERLAHPGAGLATIKAVRRVLAEWLQRRHGALTFRLTQVLSGHGCFGRYLCRIGREMTSGFHHCGAGDEEDTVDHTVAVCPARHEERRALVAQIGMDLSLPALVLSMVGGDPGWTAIASFCEAVISTKEATERERESTTTLPSR